MGATARSTVEIQMALKGAAQIRGGIASVTSGMMDAQRQVAALSSGQATLARVSAAAFQRAGDGAAKLTRSTGLARHEMVNLGYQAQDIGVMLASGQSPFLILAQQGSQVYSILAASNGGVAGALADIRARINALPVSPFALWTVGLAAAAAALAAKIAELKARMAETEALEATAGQNRRRINPLANAIQELASQQLISTAEKEAMQSALNQAAGIKADSPEGIEAQQKALQEVFRRVQNVREVAAGNDRAVELAKSQVQTGILKARYAGELAQAEAAYEAGSVKLEDYLETRRGLIEKNAEAELALLAERERNAQEAVDRSTSANRSALVADLEALKLTRVAKGIETENAVTALTREGLAFRAKEQERALADEKARLADLEAFRKRLIDAQAAALDRLERNRHAVMQAARDEFARKRDSISSDYTMTDQDRYVEQAKLIRDAMESGTISKDEGNMLKRQLGPDPASFIDNLSASVARLRSQWGTLQQQMASGIVGQVQSMVMGLGDALTSVAMGSQKAGAAFAQFGLSVLTNFVSMIIQAVLWATVAVPLLTALSVLSGGTTAAVGGPTTIAMVGGAVGAVGGMTGREAGGNMTARLPYVVGEKRPEVIVPREDSMVYPSLGAFQAQQNSRTAGETGFGNGRSAVYLVDDRRKAHKERLRRGDYDAEILDVNKRNRTSQGY